MKRSHRASQQQPQDAENKKRQNKLDPILATILMIVFDSKDTNFQTKCFAELGTSDAEEIASILARKLNMSNIK